jgi:hypothetical protein
MPNDAYGIEIKIEDKVLFSPSNKTCLREGFVIGIDGSFVKIKQEFYNYKLKKDIVRCQKLRSTDVAVITEFTKTMLPPVVTVIPVPHAGKNYTFTKKHTKHTRVERG